MRRIRASSSPPPGLTCALQVCIALRLSSHHLTQSPRTLALCKMKGQSRYSTRNKSSADERSSLSGMPHYEKIKWSEAVTPGRC